MEADEREKGEFGGGEEDEIGAGEGEGGAGQVGRGGAGRGGGDEEITSQRREEGFGRSAAGKGW